MLVKISKIRFKLTEKERNLHGILVLRIYLHEQARQCQSNNKLTTPHKIHIKCIVN